MFGTTNEERLAIALTIKRLAKMMEEIGWEKRLADLAFRRLIAILPQEQPGTIEHDFWQTIHAFEHALTEERGKTTRLFDVDNDPEEKVDLAEQRPVERRFVMDSFSLFMLHQKQWNKRRWGVASNALPALAADLE